MNTFYTGTTLECLLQIIQAGKMLTNPPKRVWDVSQPFIYLIQADEEEYEGEPFHYCVEASSFALYKLGGTKRVILEIKGIDENELTEDGIDEGPDGTVAYPRDINISNIAKIHIERTENIEKVQELVAMTHFRQNDNINSSKIKSLYESENCNKKAVYTYLNIPHLEMVDIKLLLNRQEFSYAYTTLIEEVDNNILLDEYTLDEFKEEFREVL